MRTFTVALAGTRTREKHAFNALTGLKRHTGNWSGKTVSLASGHYDYKDTRFQFIDLPGTYSLFSNSADEEVARDYIIFEKPDVTLLVLDSTALERSLNLALQVLEMTDRVIVCLNLMDEAKKKESRLIHASWRISSAFPLFRFRPETTKGWIPCPHASHVYKADSDYAVSDEI